MISPPPSSVRHGREGDECRERIVRSDLWHRRLSYESSPEPKLVELGVARQPPESRPFEVLVKVVSSARAAYLSLCAWRLQSTVHLSDQPDELELRGRVQVDVTLHWTTLTKKAPESTYAPGMVASRLPAVSVSCAHDTRHPLADEQPLYGLKGGMKSIFKGCKPRWERRNKRTSLSHEPSTFYTTRLNIGMLGPHPLCPSRSVFHRGVAFHMNFDLTLHVSQAVSSTGSDTQ